MTHPINGELKALVNELDAIAFNGFFGNNPNKLRLLQFSTTPKKEKRGLLGWTLSKVDDASEKYSKIYINYFKTINDLRLLRSTLLKELLHGYCYDQYGSPEGQYLEEVNYK